MPYFKKLNPTSQQRDFHPCVTPRNLFLSNCVSPKFVSCTSNSWEHMHECRRCRVFTLESTLILTKFLQTTSPFGDVQHFDDASRAGMPSMREAASTAVTCDSVELSDIAVCFFAQSFLVRKFDFRRCTNRFGIFKISCKVKILEQSPFALLCSISK